LTITGSSAQFLCKTNNEGIIITGYKGADHVVIIPATIDTIPVVGIGRGAFLGMSESPIFQSPTRFLK
jgi:hypothetical protein